MVTGVPWKKLKDPPIWLKVTTTLEKTPTSTLNRGQEKQGFHYILQLNWQGLQNIS